MPDIKVASMGWKSVVLSNPNSVWHEGVPLCLSASMVSCVCMLAALASFA